MGQVRNKMLFELERFEEIMHFFLFGTQPDGQHIILRCIGRTYYNEQYTIVDWPEQLRWLSIDDVAIACSQGYMPFGYHTNGPIVSIHLD